MRRITVAIVLALTVCTIANSAEFLTSARGGGLGFSYFLLADDPSGALYNPSGLGYVRGWQTQLMYEKIPGYGYPVSSEKPYYGQFGILYYRPDAGTFALNSLQSGSFAKKTAISTVNHVILSYGRVFGKAFSAGASAKYLYETMYGKRSAFDMDLGVSYRSDIGVTASAAVENIANSGLKPEYQGLTEKLPRRARLGAGYFFGTKDFEAGLLAAGQMEESGVSQKYTTTLTNIGTEWWIMPQKQFSIGARTGYTIGKAIQNDTKVDYASPTLGLSLNYKIKDNNLRLDYAWQSFPYTTIDGSKPASHYVGLTVGWGGVPSFPIPKTHETSPQIKTEINPAPAKPAPAEVALVKPAPVKPAPVEPTLVKPAPAKPAPAEVALVKPAPVKPAPEESAVVKLAPAKPAPAEAALAKPVPVKPSAILKAPSEIAFAPKEKHEEFIKSDVLLFPAEIEVNNISSVDLTRIVFYVRPTQVVKTTSWKLHIFKAKVKSWSDEEANRWSLHVIEGKGVPPINIVWDGTTKDGNMLPRGKYFFILTAVDGKGQNYATQWYNFKLE